ncbi:T6SS immunity protein Tli4 family protein [Duganella sp. Root336D2]|uniref:T6SS immunity protein Tli4 family protein n=1 Tax=Duganella sp. Root336D2 TaxID=1736518 RepID=UPI0006F1D8F7|nr:T6SS immunity protein Tli4 family protein [Duganella sp. Root336D2]KQV59302.1 hypothetical protein ASD07_24075 [Duganella sp. Root336D2]
MVVTAQVSAAPIGLRKDQMMDTTKKDSWTTHCIGRFLIDLPAEADYVGGSYDYAFATLERKPMGFDEFNQEVSSFEKRLKDTKHKSGSSLLLKSTAPDENTRVFGYWDSDYQHIAVDIAAYRWLSGQRYLLHKGADPGRMENAVVRMGTMVSKLQARGLDAPSVPGFCVEQAVFADGGTSGNESLNIRFRLKQHRDIVVDLSTNLNAGAPPESLLSRKPSVFSALGILGATLGGVRNIKEGNRTVAGNPGQEWLMKAPNDHGQQAHLFTWEAPGLQGDELHPQIRIDLQSGNSDGGLDPQPISLTDEKMLDLWERILNSLRLRPTDEGKGSPGEKPSPRADSGSPVPLGELARTGVVCPQTGYWQCPDRDVHGSPRLFQQGETMPPAVIQRDLSFIERLKGANAQIDTNTVWRLVKYAEVPSSLEAPTLLDDRGMLSKET